MDNLEIAKKIDEALNFIEVRIDAVKRQRIINAELLFSYKSGLLELKDLIANNLNLSDDFTAKWKLHLAHVSRFFEGDPLADKIFEIDKMLFNR